MTTTQARKPKGTLQQRGKSFCAGLRLKHASKTNKWRLVLLVFTIVYAAFLLLNLGYMTLQWDEMPHMNGGLLLIRGQTENYLTLYGYYPPIYDIATTVFYQLFGVSAASGRLAAVAFSLLSIWIVFEFTNRTYGPRTALLSSVLLGTMPGFFWLSRVAMLETMLIFFFSFILFFFFTWLNNEKDKALILSGLALGVGFLAKYQVLVTGLVMIVSILLMKRKKRKWRFTKFLIIPLIAGLVAAPWMIVLFQAGGLNNLGAVVYTMSGGHEERLDYSARFPLPVFYLIEMTWPYTDVPVHPVSLPIYILGLLGLCLFAWRRKPADKFFLTWFVVIYVFFTLLTNKQWRYLTPIFPVLAISAASFIFFIYEKLRVAWKSGQLSLKQQRIKQITGALFIVFAASAILYSSYESYQMTERDQIHIPIEETANYVTSHMNQNESAVIVCAFNLLNQEMFWFYLPENMSHDQIWQYPKLAVDSFMPNFNITEFVSLCEQRNVKYAILYDYGAQSPFYNTTLTYSNVTTMLYESGRFGGTGDEPFFGDMPYRTFLAGFHEPYA